MPYSLIEEEWIPIRRRNGHQEYVCPSSITDHVDGNASPIVEVDASRPDFTASLLQFLIGLVQTTLAPQDERGWRQVLRGGAPDPGRLREAFREHSEAFDLDGEEPRFQQDYERIPDASEKPIASLLLESPSNNALRKNTDHFIKNRTSHRYCRACTAAALHTMQTNAPQGGRGHRTSLRGGGPVTTVVRGETLWDTVWLNVLPHSAYGDAIEDPSRVYPWLAPTRTSSNGEPTTPEDAHPFQAYWGMPRRIYLKDPCDGGSCDLCGREAGALYSTYRTKSHGVNYEGAWQHPLTPYYRTDDGQLNPFLTKQEGFPYHQWRELASGQSSGDGQSARVVRAFYDRSNRGYDQLDSVFGGRPRLWAYGFEADRTKIRAWHEGLMPLYQVSASVREDLEALAGQFVQVADKVRRILVQSLRRALYGEPRQTNRGTSWDIDDKADSDKTFFENTSVQFWENTEALFFSILDEGVDRLVGESGIDDLDGLRVRWLDELRSEAKDLFDERTQLGHHRSADPKTVSMARRELVRFTSRGTSTIQNLLDLPDPESSCA